MSDFNRLQWDNREEGNTPLRQMQLVELRLLRVVDYICRKHGLTYFICAGTLLGAIRHKGFIPWDDDIDVAMPLEDALKFREIVEQELPADIYAATTVKSYAKSHYPCLKLYDAYSSAYTKISDAQSTRHLGISLDIFTFIPYVDDSTAKFRALYWLMRMTRSYGSKMPFLKSVVHKMLNFYDWMFRHMNTGEIKQWGHNPWSGGYGSDWRFKTEDLFPCKPIVFEGHEFMGPNNPDAYLRHYGDYMKLPPEDKRKPHEEIILPFTKCNHPKAMEWPKK